MILRAKLNYQTFESSEGIHAHIYFGKKLNNYYVFFDWTEAEASFTE